MYYNYHKHIRRTGENGAHHLTVCNVLAVAQAYDVPVEVAARAHVWYQRDMDTRPTDAYRYANTVPPFDCYLRACRAVMRR